MGKKTARDGASGCGRNNWGRFSSRWGDLGGSIGWDLGSGVRDSGGLREIDMVSCVEYTRSAGLKKKKGIPPLATRTERQPRLPLG
jgi:hypothetical protein